MLTILLDTCSRRFKAFSSLVPEVYVPTSRVLAFTLRMTNLESSILDFLVPTLSFLVSLPIHLRTHSLVFDPAPSLSIGHRNIEPADHDIFIYSHHSIFSLSIYVSVYFVGTEGLS